jgi:hypothetical protein
MVERITYKSDHEYAWAQHFGEHARYEPRSFNVKGESIFGKSYRPDFYIEQIDTWVEIKARGFNNQSHRVISQMIRANAAVRRHKIALYLLEGMPSDYICYLVSGTACAPCHFESLGLIRTNWVYDF